jgi:hypothetical protein
VSAQVHYLQGTVGEVLEKAAGAEWAIVIFAQPEGGIRVGWSKLATETLCTAKQTLDVLVLDHVRSIYEETP